MSMLAKFCFRMICKGLCLSQFLCKRSRLSVFNLNNDSNTTSKALVSIREQFESMARL